MINPSTSRAECNYHAGLVNQDSMNNPQTSNREGYNTFDKSHLVGDTQLFSEVRPCYMDAANSGDVKTIHMANNLWSPTLKSQLLTEVKMHRSFYQVPWSVIMPNTWEYLFRQPVKGEDINWRSVGPVLNIGPGDENIGSFNDLGVCLSQYVESYYAGSSAVDSSALKALFIYVSVQNAIFGQSSLPRTLGVRVLDLKKASNDSPDYVDPDTAFTNFVKGLVKLSDPDSTDNPLQSISYDMSNGDPVVFSMDTATEGDVFNFLVDLLRYADYQSVKFNFQNDDSAFTGDSFKTFAQEIVGADFFTLYLNGVDGDQTYDLMPVIAYQCLWHQFYTNDRVDDVYSAKMWQNNILSLCYNLIVAITSGDYQNFVFSINGVDVPFDAYSSFLFSKCVSAAVSEATAESYVSLWSYVMELFLIRPSMRYADYFTSMRTQPLAVGDVGVAVNENVASAIDINSSLWMQRYLNAVNRTKQSIYDYLQDLTGVLPARRAPQPNFIITETYRVGGIEVENTADSQGSIVTLLRNTQSNDMYQVFIDEPSFVIGVDSFSMNYVYPDACHKVAELNDRLDWFNDFMQHVGDQSVALREMITVPAAGLDQWDNAIGYQLRYAQYKFMVSRCCGGFNMDDTQLDSWIAQFKPFSGLVANEANWASVYHISPYFIRNHDADFDKFYSSLTAVNPASRFHFIKLIAFGENDNSKQQKYPSLL